MAEGCVLVLMLVLVLTQPSWTVRSLWARVTMQQVAVTQAGPCLGEEVSWWEPLQPWSWCHCGTTCLLQPRLLWHQEQGNLWLDPATPLPEHFPLLGFLWGLWFTIPLARVAAQRKLIQAWAAIVYSWIWAGREQNRQSQLLLLACTSLLVYFT